MTTIIPNPFNTYPTVDHSNIASVIEKPVWHSEPVMEDIYESQGFISWLLGFPRKKVGERELPIAGRSVIVGGKFEYPPKHGPHKDWMHEMLDVFENFGFKRNQDAPMYHRNVRIGNLILLGAFPQSIEPNGNTDIVTFNIMDFKEL